MTRTMTSSLAVLLCSAVVGASAQPPQKCDQPKIVTELGTRAQVPADFAPIGDGVVPYPSPAEVNAKYVRVRFTVANVPDCQWFFTVRDPSYRPIQVFDRGDFAGVATQWTQRVHGTHAVFDLSPCRDGRKPDVRFVEYIWMPSVAVNPYYSLQSAVASYREITTVETGLRRLGDVAGFLVSSWNRASWVCSGVMITPDLFLTNWHCGAPSTLPDKGFWNDDVLRDTLIDMSFDGDTRSRELTVTGVAFPMSEKNKKLDFVVLRTGPIDRVGPLRFVKIAAAAPAANENIRIVHHPAGKEKQLSWNCTVRDADYKGWQDEATRSEFTHACDTEGGSSGAPILNTDGELVGLHHLGFDFDRTKCQQIGKRENKAVKITAILDAIRNDAKGVYDEIMRWQKP